MIDKSTLVAQIWATLIDCESRALDDSMDKLAVTQALADKLWPQIQATVANATCNALVEAAREIEREECADLAASVKERGTVGAAIASAIRARGGK